MTRPDADQQPEHDLYCSTCGQRMGLAAIDPVTGLLDRWGWDERAEEALDRAGSRATTLLLVDLDGFAKISETHGAEAVEAVLRAVASILRNTLRATDVAGRHGGPGGGEFLVLLPARDRQLGELIARRIRARIRRAIIPARSVDGKPVTISNLAVSVGAAVSDPTTARTRSLAELLRQADAALHQARSRGGDQIVVAGGVVPIAGPKS